MLINLRNALMSGRRLPYDAEVEYLGGGSVDGGIAFVDTGYMPNSSTRIEATAAMLTGGAYSGRYGYGARLTFGAGNNQLYSAQGGHYFLGSFTTGRFYSFVNDIQNRTVSVDGATPTSTSAVVNWYSQSYSFYLFVSNVAPNSGSIVIAGHSIDPNSVGGMRIASCRIYDNNTLIRDFIPVRKGTVGYLYDRVSGKLFGNAGTGDFVLGPDVVPVEYIESHGTEWIDLGAVVSPDTDFQFKGTIVSNNTNGCAFGESARFSWAANNPAYALALATGGGYAYLRYGDSSANAIGVTMVGLNTPFTASLVGQDFSINGLKVATVSRINSFSGTVQTMSLFKRNNTDINSTYSIIKIESLNFGNKFHLLPVRVGTDATSWEGAMMDTLTRRIYRNAGTGAFTYGNDLKYPIPAE